MRIAGLFVQIDLTKGDRNALLQPGHCRYYPVPVAMEAHRHHIASDVTLRREVDILGGFAREIDGITIDPVHLIAVLVFGIDTR